MKPILAVLAILAIPAAAGAQIVPPVQFQTLEPAQPVQMLPMQPMRPAEPQPENPAFGGGFTATTQRFGDLERTQIQGQDGETATCRTVNFGGIVRTECN